jgi:hypothetical protein
VDIQGAFTNLVNKLSPQLPEQVGGKELTQKINSVLAPKLLNTWLPPLPSAIANSKIVQNISPRPATKGPPLPNGLSINWPSYFSRGIDRLQTEGVKGPYKTIQDKGLLAEIKREIQVVTGAKL